MKVGCHEAAFCPGNVSAYNTGTGESVLKKKTADNQGWGCCGMEAEINDSIEIVEQSYRNLHLQNMACVKKTLP